MTHALHMQSCHSHLHSLPPALHKCASKAPFLPCQDHKFLHAGSELFGAHSEGAGGVVCADGSPAHR